VVASSLIVLRDELRAVRLALDTPAAPEGRRARDELTGQIDDYLLPRLAQMDAPLLMVVGGSTGAGKSTLVNSLVGGPVSPAGVLRPTTISPVLVCNPADLRWFEDDRILPELPRSHGGGHAGELRLAPSDALPAGLALLDAPDIDSVVAANRALAGQLLAAADSWLFVTTAARYADAVPWDLLHAARDRGTAVSLVLNRVPADAVEEVPGHLRQMLAERGLGETPLLVVEESALVGGGLLGAEALAPVRAWLDGLAADAEARGDLVRRTLAGALDSVAPRVGIVRAALGEQVAAAGTLREGVEHAYAAALEEVDEAVRSGSLLRGEVLARWHEVVGTGDLMRALESRVGRWRDRLRSLVTGAPAADAELRAAVGTGVDAVVAAAADRAAERAAGAWRAHPGGRALLAGRARMDAASGELHERTEAAVRAWQGHVFELVREQGQSKRTTARLASLGVNGAGLTVMIAVFAHTGGLTGAEVAVAGGTSAVGQRVLEAIFGDQAVRSLAARAREDLMARVRELLGAEQERFARLLDPAVPDADSPGRLGAALREFEAAR
jgi:hypothetical protein